MRVLLNTKKRKPNQNKTKQLWVFSFFPMSLLWSKMNECKVKPAKLRSSLLFNTDTHSYDQTPIFVSPLALHPESMGCFSLYPDNSMEKTPLLMVPSISPKEYGAEFLILFPNTEKINCVIPKLLLGLLYPISNIQYNMYNIVIMYSDNRDGNKEKFKLPRNESLIHALKTSNHKNKILKETLMSSLIKEYNLASKVYKISSIFPAEVWISKIQKVNLKGHMP